jgi:type IV secretion system protein TrbJ
MLMSFKVHFRKVLGAILTLIFLLHQPADVRAGWPVTDITNIMTNTAKQLNQYEDQLQNTLAPAAYIWSQAMDTMYQMREVMNTLDYYKAKLHSMDEYLGKFQDVEYYRNSPCFSGEGCSDAEREILAENRRLASESQKKANDALFRTLDKQQDALEADALKLEELQIAAQSAEGRMAALQYANQIASHQANQMLQLRAVAVAQHTAYAARQQAIADKEAQQEAEAERLREGTFVPSPKVEW